MFPYLKEVFSDTMEVRLEYSKAVAEHVLRMQKANELSSTDPSASYAASGSEIPQELDTDTLSARRFSDIGGEITVRKSASLEELERKCARNGITVERRKEGILHKSWVLLGYKQRRPHWCCADSGFFWYYDYEVKDSIDKYAVHTHH